ncbi:cggR protein [Lactobacillus selangorensis]|uniref:CggR protein n=1 Tax=Lactobacillus selangorensis TaxID=81857 RepID=A0A0R2FUC1_9LACO|nr:sugar-binding domain-containing protein [Lactobacillus selangorensis]KRN28503.1 cggR protein [Lactobacillus selangorensis]KRN32003.1 cggR protein [Lactobacillus selangorensis]
MHSDFNWIEDIAPDLMSVITKRYQILQNINWMEPIGRRSLAQKLNVSERVLRTETDFLKAQGLLNSTKSGMVLTKHGNEVYEGISHVMNQFLGVSHTEKKLSQYLGIERCLIISGNSDEQPKVMAEIGKMVNQTLQIILPLGRDIIAVMGGTTMARVATELTPKLSDRRELLFVPARGGVGENVTIQANNVAAQMAKHSDGKYRAMYLPENVSPDTYASLMKEPSIKEVVTLIDKSQTVLHSIGEALTMAKRRHLSSDVIDFLEQRRAVAEAFGYFFNAAGSVVYKIPRIGMQIRDLKNKPYVIAVAAGESKAKAIDAYMKNAPHQTWLITDEGAAKMILKGATL